MGLDKYDRFYYGPGLYLWKSKLMAKNHFIVVQISEYANPEIAPGRFHAEMLLPVSGGMYHYEYDGPIEKMPRGKFYGPLNTPYI